MMWEVFWEAHLVQCPAPAHLRAEGYAEVQLPLLIFGNTGGNFRLKACHLSQLGIAKQATKCWKNCIFMPQKGLSTLVEQDGA